MGFPPFFKRWALDDVCPPWGGPSLYEILKLNGAGAALPERPKRNENELGWIAGALDGDTGHQFTQAAADQIQNRTKLILGAVARLLKRPSQENLSALLAELESNTFLRIADAL